MQTMLAKNEALDGAATSLTRVLLACGVLAGPLYIVVGLLQVLFRAGFDIRKHDLSLLSNGDLGWIQIANFLVTGAFVIAFAVGLGRVLQGQGAKAAPILLGIYGFGLIGAGIFVADPALGFPIGTPADAHNISTSGLLHFVSGGIGFLGLIAACFVFARRFTKQGDVRWAAFSAVTGVVFFAAFVGIATGSNGPANIMTLVIFAFTGAVVLAWIWLALLAVRVIREFPAVH